MGQTAVTNVDVAENTCLPKVVERGLARNWPATLNGSEIVDLIILIECGVSAKHYRMWREDEHDNATWETYLDDRYTARLTTMRIVDVKEPEGGCAEQAHAEYYSTLTTKAPPIIIDGDRLMDGNHRLEAARIRGETLIDAYIISLR